MKGAVSLLVIALVAVVLVGLVGYAYNNNPAAPQPSTGRAVTDAAAEPSRLGFLESCNPNKDRCDAGLVCKLARDSVYRCLNTG